MPHPEFEVKGSKGASHPPVLGLHEPGPRLNPRLVEAAEIETGHRRPAFKVQEVQPVLKPYLMDATEMGRAGQFNTFRGQDRHWIHDHLLERPNAHPDIRPLNRAVAPAGQYPMQTPYKYPAYAEVEQQRRDGAQYKTSGLRAFIKSIPWKEAKEGLEALSEIRDAIDLATMKTAWDVLDDEDKAAEKWLANNANRGGAGNIPMDWKAVTADMKDRDDARKEGAAGIAKYNYKKGTVKWQKEYLLDHYRNNWPSYRKLHPEHNFYRGPNAGIAGAGRQNNSVGMAPQPGTLQSNTAVNHPVGPDQNVLPYGSPAYQDYPVQQADQQGYARPPNLFTGRDGRLRYAEPNVESTPGLSPGTRAPVVDISGRGWADEYSRPAPPPPDGLSPNAQAAYMTAGPGPGQYAGFTPGRNA